MSTSTPIILLKTPALPTDPYFTRLSTLNYTPRFVFPLSHTLRPPSLTLLLPTPKYGALIFTSARAVEAFALSLTQCSNPDDIAALAVLNLPIYVVGPATESAVGEVQRRWLKGCSVLGAECGNGEALAKLIRRDYKGGGKVGFLVGEMRRDIIPRTLMEGEGERIAVEEVVVYETGVRREFGGEFEMVVREMEGGWVVVFSPQGGEEVLKGLGWLDGEMARMREGWEVDRRWWVASIGPTTREYLRERFGFRVDVCAERPSPEGVQMGIEKFMRSKEVQRGVDNIKN